MLSSKSILLFLFLLTGALFANGQKEKNELFNIKYQTVIDGNISEKGSKIILIAGPEQAKIYTIAEKNLLPQTPDEIEYIDFFKKVAYQSATLHDGKQIYTETPFSEFPVLEETGEIEEILGYRCKKVKTTLRSNSIEIWYTSEPDVKGTPLISHGIADGLVLRVIRNNNYGLIATEIDTTENKKKESILPKHLGKKTDISNYRYLITKSFVTTVNIFDNEQISWENSVENPEGKQMDNIHRYAGGTIILKQLELPKVSLDYRIFAELTQFSNGDAYDRTGTVFIIPENKEKSFFTALTDGVESVPAFHAANGKNYYATVATSDFSPAVELIRFFTPFGIRHFNEQVQVHGQEWEKQAFYKQEITELLPLLQTKVWIGVFIGNYDKGGHKVSLDLKYFPGKRTISETDNKEKQWIYPLFNTLNIMEMAGQDYGTMFENDSLCIEFEVPNNLRNVILRYVSTGHGGWGGGDEFNQKPNEIFIDGKFAGSVIPWNCNCGSFRRYNPASGNFRRRDLLWPRKKPAARSRGNRFE